MFCYFSRPMKMHYTELIRKLPLLKLLSFSVSLICNEEVTALDWVRNRIGLFYR